MHARVGRLAVASAIVLFSVSVSGCLTVYPAKELLSGQGAGNSVVIERVVAYEASLTAKNGIESGSDTRTIFVPPGSESVTIKVYAKLSSLPPPLEGLDTRHFDFTVADGTGTDWADVHLRNNSTDKVVTVDGPRPGGWTVTLNYQIQGGVPGLPSDQFDVQVIVAAPAS